MNYPECPTGSEDCRFERMHSHQTAAYSPLQYDRHGNVVGGGNNRVSEALRCITCRHAWKTENTEFQLLQGVVRQWYPI